MDFNKSFNEGLEYLEIFKEYVKAVNEVSDNQEGTKKINNTHNAITNYSKDKKYKMIFVKNNYEMTESTMLFNAEAKKHLCIKKQNDKIVVDGSTLIDGNMHDSENRLDIKYKADNNGKPQYLIVEKDSNKVIEMVYFKKSWNLANVYNKSNGIREFLDMNKVINSIRVHSKKVKQSLEKNF